MLLHALRGPTGWTLVSVSERLAAWPEETPLREKLYGDLVALKKTASFVRAAGVDI